jgi:two-component system response regulator PilR (NtrC family)
MSARLLVVDDEASLREILSVLFRRAGYDVAVAPSVQSGLAVIAAEEPFDVVVTDLMMPDGSGMRILEGARAKDETTQVVMITAYATTEQAVEAMRQGAYDYVQKPFRNEALRATIDKALEKRSILSQNEVLRAEVQRSFRGGELIGRSPALRGVIDLIERIANAPTSVLLTGESGTGKEVVARALHASGTRAAAKFVAVNCGALPEALMESELFGHEKGAYTGAGTREDGLFRTANGGTLFLDEVGELPLPLQVKLLRVLQERKVRPVGGKEEIPVDVRVVAATNVDIDEAVREGAFRQDLFYRLNVIRMHLPPLRERTEDVPLLAQHFLRKHAALHGKRLRMSPDAMRLLTSHTYPGNVRELENLIERAVTLARTDVVLPEDLGPQAPSSPLASEAPPVGLPEGGLDLDAYLAATERQLLLQALEQSGGVRTRAAKLLRTSFRSLRYRLAKYGIAAGTDDGEGGDVSDG